MLHEMMHATVMTYAQNGNRWIGDMAIQTSRMPLQAGFPHIGHHIKCLWARGMQDPRKNSENIYCEGWHYYQWLVN